MTDPRALLQRLSSNTGASRYAYLTKAIRDRILARLGAT